MAIEDNPKVSPPSVEIKNTSKESTSLPSGDNLKVSSPSGKDKDPNERGFFNRPRAGGKTVWDWLNLLAAFAIPLVVVLATIGFGWWQVHLADIQHQQDQQNALDQQHATTLQTYIDNIQELLLKNNLRGSKPDGEVAILARARTLTALQGLDPDRKGRLVQFLYEAQLIGFVDTGMTKLIVRDPIINLTGVTLEGANLSFADLSGADLSGAFLSDADLFNANLRRATLSGADLSDANLSGADLSDADLSDAHLNNAHLSGATSLTQKQLDQVFLCTGATLPKGLICNKNP